MLKIEKFTTPSPAQWEITLEGMRNPKNSWDRMDSYEIDGAWFMGENDHTLAMSLAKGGSVHAKYRRMLPVHVTINAPLYWWKEFDTYRVGVAPNPTDIEINSCSTMHKIHAKEFDFTDFSCEHLFVEGSMERLAETIEELNKNRALFLETGDKDYWWQMIQLLPSSYNQKRTMSSNYEALSHMWFDRHEHKQDCWRTLCHWIEELPYAEIMVSKSTRFEAIDPSSVLDDRPMGGFKDI